MASWGPWLRTRRQVSIERTGDSGNHLTAITVTFRIAFPDGEVGDKARAILPGAGGTEIGWRLARHAWHRGYATEAALAARDVAFTGAALAELWSMTAVLNTPSPGGDALHRHDRGRTLRVSPHHRRQPSQAARGLPPGQPGSR